MCKKKMVRRSGQALQCLPASFGPEDTDRPQKVVGIFPATADRKVSKKWRRNKPQRRTAFSLQRTGKIHHEDKKATKKRQRKSLDTDCTENTEKNKIEIS